MVVKQVVYYFKCQKIQCSATQKSSPAINSAFIKFFILSYHIRPYLFKNGNYMT